MASGPRKPGRPVVGSRNPTARPRTVAGRRDETVETPETTAPDPTYAVSPRHDPPPTVVEPVEARGPEPTPVEPVETSTQPSERTRRVLGSGRATIALVVALVLLVGALAAEGWYLKLREDPIVSASRPVVTGEIAHRAAVEAASQSVTDILTYGYQDFDAQIDEATAQMTDSFAQQFRDTAEDIKGDFVADRTEQEVKIVAASVVQASAQQVRALLFLDQYVAKAGKGTAVTPYRALVTVVHTDSGWLVSDIETQ